MLHTSCRWGKEQFPSHKTKLSGLSRAIARVQRSLDRVRGAETRDRLRERIARLTALRQRLLAAAKAGGEAAA